MKSLSKTIVVILACLTCSGMALSQAGELIFSQTSDGQSAYGPSELWAPAGVNSEVADDFEVIGNIDRVFASGFIWGAVDFQGVYVRFYSYGADGKPGALQKEYFLTPGFNQGAIDVTLSPAFPATGKHFLSVQPVSDYWYWGSSHTDAPRGQPFYFRNLAAGQTAWQHGDNLNFNANADAAFWLYGTVTGPGHINNLSANTLARSGYLEIFGASFGGSGQVLIDGIAAPIANWESTRIVAYVPEAARLTTVPVQVVNASGQPGNIANLTVTARSASGRVNWRFRMDGPYAQVRPVIAADGTVYAIDVFSHLYALAPDGGLKWLVRGAGDKGVAVGADGAVYVASEDAIRAFNPDGSTKWTFVQNPRAFICLGVSVGPDGNIYAVGTHGMGVFSLTPAGVLRWTNAELYRRPIVDYGEIVFGPNGSNQQLYFYANDHIRGLRLDGSSVFTILGGLDQLKPGLQPVVAPDGSVHIVLGAYAPSGSSLWSFPTPYPYNVFTPADIDSVGIHYFVQNLSQLFALNPDGSQRWHVALTNYLRGPIVDSLNTQLVMGSADTLDHAGFILSASAKDGHELWRVVLPAEDPNVFNPAIGIYGFNQYVDTRARFTADGSTAYVVTATATGDNNTSRSFVYSLNAIGGNQPPVAKVSATPTSGTAPLAVSFSSAGSSDPEGSIASCSWNFGDGGVSTAANPSHTYASAGIYTATLTVTDNAGAIASASVAVTVTASTAKTLRSTAINLSATLLKNGTVTVTVTGVVTVKDKNGAVIPSATVAAKWTLPNGTTQNQTATTATSGNANFSTKSGRGTYKLTVTNISKTGYTFDKVNSVLSKSITK